MKEGLSKYQKISDASENIKNTNELVSKRPIANS